MLLEYSYKQYMSDVPYLQAEQKMHAKRWSSLFEKPKPEQDGDEVALELIEDLGLQITV